jgi:hypothetical protein
VTRRQQTAGFVVRIEIVMDLDNKAAWNKIAAAFRRRYNRDPYPAEAVRLRNCLMSVAERHRMPVKWVVNSLEALLAQTLWRVWNGISHWLRHGLKHGPTAVSTVLRWHLPRLASNRTPI